MGNSHITGEVYNEIQGAGNRIYITSQIGGDTYEFGYWHLSVVLAGPGDYVTQGQLIGYTGTTGNASASDSAGPHLHLRGRKNNIAYDPENSIGLKTDFDNNGKPIESDCSN